MARKHVITARVVTPAVVDPETGEITSPETVSFETTEVPFTPEEEAAADAEEAAWLARVPPTVSPYQARVALLNAGLLDIVEALMVNPDTPQAAKIAWEYATVWERNSAFIATLGPALGLTDSQIDDLFRAAGQVS